ncbi:MAG TPA: efflux RND transporter periplasmic adaptor subunit [Candidatus Nanoarchaeia archaeon]|nr:efflux RND transporter periplasmic adaptor subunit [Candidatus Nanoarchaeia archaeon]
MNNFFSKIRGAIVAHKIITVLAIIILAVIGYYGYQKLNTGKIKISYVTQAISRSTINVSVTGSGQVSELNSVDIKPQVSGNSETLVTLNIKKGDQVKAGQVLAIIDQRAALASISQAKSQLTNAQANYQTLIAGPTAVDVNISQNSVTQAENSYNNALLSQQNTIQTTATNVTQAQNALADLEDTTSSANPTNKRGVAITTIDNVLTQDRSALDAENKIFSDDNFKAVFGATDSSSVNSAKNNYNQALALLDTAENSLANVKVNRTDANIDQSVNDAVNALNVTQNSLNYCYTALQNTVSGASVSQSTIDSYKSSINGQLSTINSGITSIQNADQGLKDAITADQNALQSAQLSEQTQLAQAKASVDSAYNSWQNAKDQLAKLTAPPTAQNVNSDLAAIASAKTQLDQAVNDYNNTIITAPFDGLIAAVTPHQGDQVSPSTVIATLITNQYVAIIPLNEVDVAKVKTGDAAVMTFDALPDLNMTGKVIDIDTIGTVSQGVVTYNVKIALDTQDPAVKPGMSASVTIITEVKADVLSAPNAAVKSQGTSFYVQKLDASGQPQNVPVQIGIANDAYTEIISGVNEGDQVITQTITSAAAKAAASTSGLNSLLGGGRAAGGFTGGATFRAGGGAAAGR